MWSPFQILQLVNPLEMLSRFFNTAAIANSTINSFQHVEVNNSTTSKLISAIKFKFWNVLGYVMENIFSAVTLQIYPKIKSTWELLTFEWETSLKSGIKTPEQWPWMLFCFGCGLFPHFAFNIKLFNWLLSHQKSSENHKNIRFCDDFRWNRSPVEIEISSPKFA